MSLGLKWVSCRQHIYRSWFCILSASLCLFFFVISYNFKFHINGDIYKVFFSAWLLSLSTFFFNFYLFIYLFLAVLGLRFCVRAFCSCGEWGHSSSQCAGLSPSRPLLLWSTGSRHAGSVIVAHWPSRSAACGIFPGQGSNPCPLHWQADSQPLCHQGSPALFYVSTLLHV